MNFNEKCAHGSLKELSLNAGGLKDRFNCTYIFILYMWETVKLQLVIQVTYLSLSLLDDCTSV